MQNLAAASAANLQLFSKALQESAAAHAQQQQHVPADDQQQQQQAHPHAPPITAADFQQFMLSQLNEQLHLGQFAGGFGSALSSVDTNNTTTTHTTNSSSTETATTTASSIISPNPPHPADPTASADQKQAKLEFGIGQNEAVDGMSQRAQQMAQQKLMEQLLEAASGVTNGQQPGGGGGHGQQQQQTTDEQIGQLMAQLIGGDGGANGGADLHNQLVQQLTGTPQHQQRAGETQSTSPLQHQQHNQQQQQISLMEQLQLLQMLGGGQGNAAALAELLAVAGPPNEHGGGGGGQFQSHHHSIGGQEGMGGGGGGHHQLPTSRGGGSPNKDADTYCEFCDKNLCNRYFLQKHKERKHGILSGSPTKFNNGTEFRQFFAQQQMDEHPGRAQSASLHHQQQRNSPSSTGQHKQKQSLSSTPGFGNGPTGHPPATTTAATTLSASAMNDSLSSTDHQNQLLMSQCIMQQLAAQLGLPPSAITQNGQSDRPALIDQILGAGLPLAELLQQQQGRGASPAASSHSPDANGCFPCAQCANKQFATQSALFHHQLTEHIGNEQQQGEQQQQQLAAALRWPLGGTEIGTSRASGATGLQQQQQQQHLMGQLLGTSSANQFSTNHPNSTVASLSMLSSPFGQINPGELDGAAMLAKLSAELAAVSQAQGGTPQQQQQSHQQQGIMASQQNGNPLAAVHHHHHHLGGAQSSALQHLQHKPTPPKRQYQSTSKNFCDLCNKEVCNKYFLRTHMLKMHNIVIDENKVVIANIDTAEKERRGEVKFRCEICGNSMTTREQLKQHKKEVHGMTTALGGGGVATGLGMMGITPKSSTAGLLQKTSLGGGGNAMETMEAGRRFSTGAAFPHGHFGLATEFQHQSRRGEDHSGERMAKMMKIEGEEGRGGEGMMAERTASMMNDENHQPIERPAAMLAREEEEEDEEGEEAETNNGDIGGGGAATALPTSVKELLNQLVGDSLLGHPTKMPQLTGMDDKNDSKDIAANAHHSPHLTNGHPTHLPHDANNNATTCRFCGLCLESEEHLQLHHLMKHLDLVPTENQEVEEKLITQVALQMAQANKAAAAALRKSSAASSGASSSSSSSSAASSAPSTSSAAAPHEPLGIGSPLPSAAAAVSHQCPQCKRNYKSALKLAQHQNMVHHNFVAKISPTKKTLTISPKKKAKMLKSFTCLKCQRRFGTKSECNEHVIFAHIRHGNEEGEDPTNKRAKIDENHDAGAEDDGMMMMTDWIREEEEGNSSSNMEGLGRLMVDEGEEEEAEEKEEEGTSNGGRDDADGKKPPAAHEANGRRKEGEKHSHTSGSTSPLSVQAASSSSMMALLPEGYAHPTAEHQQKPFVLQSFTVRPIPPPSTSLTDGDGQQYHQHFNHQALPDELVAYLPVRTTLSEPFRVTLELQPNPCLDSQVRHL